MHLRRAVLAVGWNGWFWGHFVQDVLSKLAVSIEVLEHQDARLLHSVAFILEGDSQVELVKHVSSW